MTITVTHQKPAVLDPVHTISYTGDYDPVPAVEKALVEPLRAPLTPGVPASILNDKGTDLSGSIDRMLFDCLGDTMNASAEKDMKDLLGQTLVNFDPATTLPVHELFAVQAGHRHKMPMPSPRVVYTAKDDIVPAAKGLLAGNGDGDEFFASLAYAFHPNTLGFWFQSEATFDEFKAWLSQQVGHLSGVLPADTTKLLNDFDQLALSGLTESLLLRKDDSDNNEEFSFARVLVHMLMSWVDQQRKAGMVDQVGAMPFSVGELFCPQSLVFVNVDAHARTKPAKITKEWTLIDQSLASPVKMISNRNLSKLTTAQRFAKKMSAMAASTKMSAGQPGNRSAKVAFRKMPPTKINLFASILRVLKRMGTVNRSQNIFRQTKSTFLKANRRDPDDVNKPGKITSISYLPDLHVYVDTSGSISEANYQEAIMSLIQIAKKLNVNLYFNSFSHILSQETLLKVEGKSVNAIWHEFRNVPKVTGWTDYLQIWQYINASPKRRRRMSLVITDFEWSPPSSRVEQPKNLYYAPCSAMDWDRMRYFAKEFADSMVHIDPTIHQKMLGMYA